MDGSVEGVVMNEINNQLDMFTTPKAVARETDPETSWEAAVNITGIRESQAKVWIILVDHGPLIDDEIHFHMLERGWMISESGCRTRRNELVQLGLVKFNDTWGQTAFFNRARQWRAVSLDIWYEKEFSKYPQIKKAFETYD